MNSEPLKALITGVTGQSGTYLAKLLIDRGLDVYGLVRRTTSAKPLWRLEKLLGDDLGKLKIVEGDLTDQRSLDLAVERTYPDYVFNLAAQSFVGRSFTEPHHTMEVTGYGAVAVFDAVRRFAPHARVYQASSSELFGLSPGPQNEQTPMIPCSPYGCAKLYAHHMANVYRNAYAMKISCGILFNHESPLRGGEFVTQSVARQVARVALGKSDTITVGNINAKRDWGYAGDYVSAMWKMVNSKPDDFVIATGETRSVEDFINIAMASAKQQCGTDAGKARIDGAQIMIDSTIVNSRPMEVPLLLGDATKAREELDWIPETPFDQLVFMMIENAITEEMSGK